MERIQAVKKNILTKPQVWRKLIVKVNSQCNNNCRFCIYSRRDLSAQVKSKEYIMGYIDKLMVHNFKEIIFTGGEPTLRADICDLINHAHRLGLKTQFQTNGRLLAYQSFCRAAITSGVDCFCIAIHGHNAEMHDYLTNTKGSFRQATLAIENLISMGQTVVTNTVITRQNYRYLPKIAKLLLDLKVDKYQLIFPHITGEAYRNRRSVVITRQEAVPFVKKAIKTGRDLNCEVTVKAIPFCLLKGYESHVRRSIYPDEKYIFFGSNVSCKFWKNRLCKKCIYDNKCEGVWYEYPRLYGQNEFIPVQQS